MDVMLDIETLANSSNSAITQIGAAVFNRQSGEIIDTFKVNVAAQSCIDIGMEMNVDTVEWWMQQSDEARKSVLKGPKKEIYYALEDFSEFIKNNWLTIYGPKMKENHQDPMFAPTQKDFCPADVILWCHATFDEPNVSNAYYKCGLKSPWHYRSVRDIRTLIDLTGHPVPKSTGVAHDALDDALHQVKYVVEALSKVTING